MTNTDISTDGTAQPEPARQSFKGAPVGEALPKAMGIGDMCRAFGISYPTFRKLERNGEFRPFALARAIGPRRWSGEKVQAFLNGRK